MITKTVYNKFNRGEVDPLALARDDVEKINNSSSFMDNWLPLRLGPMMYRPGLEHVAELGGFDNNFTVPFIRSTTERAILAFQDNYLRIYTIDENDNVELIPGDSSTTSITNGQFTTDISGWTDSSGGSATADWTADKDGCLSLTGAGTNEASVNQTLSTDTGAEHVLRVVVRESPVTIRIGTSGANSKNIYEGEMKPGDHYLNFTPNATVTITLVNNEEVRALVGRIEFASDIWFDFEDPNYPAHAGVNGDTIRDLKWTQSGDIVFFAAGNNIPQFQIERHSDKSWSLVGYKHDDGPFGGINVDNVTLTPAALTGNTTLTASRAFFSEDSVGQLFKLVSSGQQRSANVSAEDSGTDSIIVTGFSGASRTFNYTITYNAASATITLQRSVDGITWEDTLSYTASATVSLDDDADGTIYYYRLYCKSGDFTSGDIDLFIDYAGGSVEGIGRVTKYTSDTVVDIQVLTDFGATTGTRNWYPGQWNKNDGFPSAAEIYEGRLSWAGQGQFWASVSDAYTSFDRDEETLGNSASIYRTIGFGPTDKVNWLKKGIGLVLGILSDEISIRSSNYGESLTNTNTNLRSGSTQGSSSVPPERSDKTVYFSHMDNQRLFALIQRDMENSETEDQCVMNPSICTPGIIRIAITRQPETRIWVVLADGTARVFLIDEIEGVVAWSRMSTPGGLFKDVISIRGESGSGLFFVVKRGSSYMLERLAQTSEAVGGNISKSFDAFIQVSSPGDSIDVSSSPALLAESELAVWADGQYRGTFPVSGNTINVGASYADLIVGIPYTANYTSNKLMGYTDQSTLTSRRRVTHTGIIARNLWRSTFSISGDGVEYQNMPDIERGTNVDNNALIQEYDEPPIPFPGGSKTDARVYLRASGPATIMALVYEIESAGNKGTK